VTALANHAKNKGEREREREREKERSRASALKRFDSQLTHPSVVVNPLPPLLHLLVVPPT